MIRFLLHRLTRKMSRQYDYDTTYMHEIIDTSIEAAIRLSMLSAVSQYRAKDEAIWAGALLASTLEGDCGPCAQLVVDMALALGVEARLIKACLARDFQEAGRAGLGFRFAEAAISGDLRVDVLRLEIEKNYGKETALAAAFAAASGRAYPVLKRGLGHGAACHKIRIGRDDIMVKAA